ncbi:hypothetical protein D9C73_022812 [Collichthys lucidus]|uniref:Uncharacterized protein n=1 Tax=Collichthys lucidus TaxID=240159 RepID=A0A4U5VK32_COLLU|nr:hypothetical protein D9C73_022812 [Collichthys lucidus]
MKEQAISKLKVRSDKTKKLKPEWKIKRKRVSQMPTARWVICRLQTLSYVWTLLGYMTVTGAHQLIFPLLRKHTAPSCCIRLIRVQAAATFHAVKSGGYEVFVCTEIFSEYLHEGVFPLGRRVYESYNCSTNTINLRLKYSTLQCLMYEKHLQDLFTANRTAVFFHSISTQKGVKRKKSLEVTWTLKAIAFIDSSGPNDGSIRELVDVSAAENPVSHALNVPRYRFYIPRLVVDNTATGLSEYFLRMNFPLDDVSPQLEAFTSCHGISMVIDGKQKAHSTTRGRATPPSYLLWICNVSAHIVAPHDTSRVGSHALRRRAEGACVLRQEERRSETPIRSASSFPLVNNERCFCSRSSLKLLSCFFEKPEYQSLVSLDLFRRSQRQLIGIHTDFPLINMMTHHCLFLSHIRESQQGLPRTVEGVLGDKITVRFLIVEKDSLVTSSGLHPITRRLREKLISFSVCVNKQVEQCRYVSLTNNRQYLREVYVRTSRRKTEADHCMKSPSLMSYDLLWVHTDYDMHVLKRGSLVMETGFPSSRTPMLTGARNQTPAFVLYDALQTGKERGATFTGGLYLFLMHSVTWTLCSRQTFIHWGTRCSIANIIKHSGGHEDRQEILHSCHARLILAGCFPDEYLLGVTDLMGFTLDLRCYRHPADHGLITLWWLCERLIPPLVLKCCFFHASYFKRAMNGETGTAYNNGSCHCPLIREVWPTWEVHAVSE